MNKKDHKDIDWLVRATTIRAMWVVMFIILTITVIVQIFADIHGHFGVDKSFGFNAWYGFITCILMVFISKFLSIFVKRKDNYYDD